MAEQYTFDNDRGFFGIGIYQPKFESNIGVLWRHAGCFEADFIYTIGKRYKPQRTDTLKAYKHIPMFEYDEFEEFTLPRNTDLVCVEITDDSENLFEFKHPERAVYMLGAEDGGIPEEILTCKKWGGKKPRIVQIPSKYCMNVSCVGSIVMYDRKRKDNV